MGVNKLRISQPFIGVGGERCSHGQVSYDPATKRVWCDGCGEVLDVFALWLAAEGVANSLGGELQERCGVCVSKGGPPILLGLMDRGGGG